MTNDEKLLRGLLWVGLLTWVVVIVFSLTINLFDGQPGEALNYALGVMAGLFLAYWIGRLTEGRE